MLNLDKYSTLQKLDITAVAKHTYYSSNVENCGVNDENIKNIVSACLPKLTRLYLGDALL